jgi:prepilin-type N-terminal cleavage/methylation domain-containing protein
VASWLPITTLPECRERYMECLRCPQRVLGCLVVPAEPTKTKGKPRRGQGGYSAIELVIVLAIMSILIGVSVPVYSGITARAHQVVHQEQVAGLAEQSQINQILAGS